MNPGYSEEDGLIVLRLDRDDFTRLMTVLRYAALRFARNPTEGIMTLEAIAGLMNRLNEGNPIHRPYQTRPSPGF